MHVSDTDIKNELQVIEAAKRNPDHFAPLYERYHKPIFVFVYKKVQDVDLTADITSTVFLKALLNIKKYRFKGFPFSAWLFRIASNEVNMHYRNEKKMIKVEVQERDVKVLMGEMKEDDSQEQLERLLEGLGKLPVEQSQLIDMRFFEKRSFKEMGEIMGMSEDNAKVRTYRALKKLKTVITSMK